MTPASAPPDLLRPSLPSRGSVRDEGATIGDPRVDMADSLAREAPTVSAPLLCVWDPRQADLKPLSESRYTDLHGEGGCIHAVADRCRIWVVVAVTAYFEWLKVSLSDPRSDKLHGLSAAHSWLAVGAGCLEIIREFRSWPGIHRTRRSETPW
jgi:hypothetical protein